MQIFLAVEERGQAQLSAAGGREGLVLTALNPRKAEGEKGVWKGRGQGRRGIIAVWCLEASWPVAALFLSQQAIAPLQQERLCYLFRIFMCLFLLNNQYRKQKAITKMKNIPIQRRKTKALYSSVRAS